MSTTFGLPSFSVPEVDDIMEVSSEQGHNAGDDDIDIDFELGAADEDHILDDAISNTGFDHDLLAQKSPAPGNDETMFDDESYQAYEGSHTQEQGMDGMDHEALTMSFDAPELTDVQLREEQVLNSSNPAFVLDSETQNTPEPVVSMSNVSFAHDLHQDPLHDVADIMQDPHLEDFEDESRDRKVDGSHHASPSGSNNSNAPTKGRVTSPITVPRISDDAAIEHGPGHHVSDISEDDIKKVDVVAEGDTPDFSPSVVVAYQDTEYTLFASSDSDDPDSFFLSDFAILGKPLTSFFEAIRQVIIEDLADDDELCVVVEDLGLEIMENYVSDQDITFGQIIDLYAKLLQNDGVASPRSLHMYLGTRPSFRVRFANLTKTAEEGKGLSEVNNWDEQSESAGGSEGLAQYHQGDESVLEQGQVYGEIHSHSSPQGEDDTADRLSNPDSNPMTGANTGGGVINGATSTEPQAATDATPPVGEESVPNGITDAKNDNGEYDEDGDLLDYSDEEVDFPASMNKILNANSPKIQTDDSSAHNGTYTDFISPCFKPDTCFCSKCNDLLLAEYETKNEELRRSSITRSAQEDASSEPAELVGTVDEDNKQLGQEVAEDGVDYDDEDPSEEISSHAVTEHDHRFTVDHLGHQHETKDEKRSDDPDLGNETEFQDGKAELENGGFLEIEEIAPIDGQQQNLEGGNETYDDIIEFGDEEFAASEDQLASGEAGTANSDLPSDHIEGEAVPDMTVFEPAEFEEIESIGSDKTLEAQATSELEQEDEIDYDDDEAQDTAEFQSPVVKESPILHTTPNKRPRADDNSDEALSARNKDAKRPRS